MKTERFTYPTLHVINADSQCVIWSEPYASTTWYPDRSVISKGEARYRIKNQQLGVQHYYVWVEVLH